MPFRTLRSSTRGVPGGLFGNKGWMIGHAVTFPPERGCDGDRGKLHSGQPLTAGSSGTRLRR
jgi:hypothetical protein